MAASDSLVVAKQLEELLHNEETPHSEKKDIYKLRRSIEDNLNYATKESLYSVQPERHRTQNRLPARQWGKDLGLKIWGKDLGIIQ